MDQLRANLASNSSSYLQGLRTCLESSVQWIKICPAYHNLSAPIPPVRKSVVVLPSLVETVCCQVVGWGILCDSSCGSLQVARNCPELSGTGATLTCRAETCRNYANHMIIMLIISQFAPRNFPALILSCCRIVKFVGVFKTLILDGSVYQDFVCEV